VRRLDAGLPILDLNTLDVRMSENLERERALAIITTGLAFLALLLAGAGLYGVISYTVARRTREIGIRVTVGATQWVILGQVFRESFWVMTAGVVGGSMASLAGAQLTRGLLFGVEPQDPTTLVFAGAISFALGLLATWVPARRAMAVDPAQALRHE
jgi:ABC-type antimicrobial peptide transport system permease subunit